jgi:1-acyl-sn-glycerol-3-phosphate acyltransferase
MEAATYLHGAARRGQPDPLYRSVVGLALLTCKVMRWNVDVTGARFIPAEGPAVLASNHVGNMDFVFLGFAGHRRGRLVRFMAMQEAFDHWLAGPLLRGMRHIPVDRRGDAAASYRDAVGALRSGEVVGVHPEGKINRSSLPAAGKSGAVRMALATGAPLIPAAVWGSQRLVAPGEPRKFPRNLSISVTIGEPIHLDATADAARSTTLLMERIGGLLRGADSSSARPATLSYR